MSKSGVLIPALALHHFHNITIEGNTSSKHSAASSLQTNLLILSCPLKLLSSMAKVNTSKLKAMNKGNANKQHFSVIHVEIMQGGPGGQCSH